jgi:4a-hydroxytetrahydrobiopterin dehydratase
MTELHLRHCSALSKDSKPLEQHQIDALLAELADWQQPRPTEIQRVFSFQDYYQTMAFVNAVAWIAHHNDHHPEMQVGYNQCTVVFSTHSVKGLSLNDFICAAKVDRLL